MHVNELPNYDPKNPVAAHPDEKCFGILETDLRTESEDGRSTVHRFQIIDFLRGNTKLREVRDLNKLKLYSALDNALPYRHFSLLEHSVGECLEIADAARERGKNRAREFALKAAESTLIPDAIKRSEQVRKVIRKQSHFGPSQTAGRQRN